MGYNADGMRAWKENSSSARTFLLYDGSDLIAELTSAGALSTYQTIGADGVVSRRAGTTSLFYAFDPEGSAAAVLNAGAAVQGDELTEANGRHDGGYASSPVEFGGQWGYYTDAETGLSLLGHRYYDSGAGRFLTRDPIRYNGGVNLYGYTANDYENEIDPDGYATVEVDYHAVPITSSVATGGYHAFIVVTGNDGKQWEIAGGPTPGVPGWDTEDKNIYVQWGPYPGTSKSPSYDHPGCVPGDTLASRPKPTILIKDSKPASYYIDRFQKIGEEINISDIGYGFLGDNSNTTAREIIARSGTGLKPPTKRPVWTPGWDNILPIVTSR